MSNFVPSIFQEIECFLRTMRIKEIDIPSLNKPKNPIFFIYDIPPVILEDGGLKRLWITSKKLMFGFILSQWNQN